MAQAVFCSFSTYSKVAVSGSMKVMLTRGMVEATPLIPFNALTKKAFVKGVKLSSASVLLEPTSAGAGAVVAKRSDIDICKWWAAR